jgi:iron complex outermembrane receptor protein
MWAVSVGLFAQNITVNGTVTDANGEPVIGATVVMQGNASHGTVTDIDGNYALSNVPGNATLQFSYVGLTAQTVAVNGRTVINVVMDADTELLDEVVVTALGMKRSAKALGYAMTELKGDDLNTNLINPVSALQGKVAGVEIANSDGGLFGSTKIQIRGASTLGKNNQPIYVVDGVILSNDIKEGNPDWDSEPKDYGNALKNLNPDDFETVSVLKGAAATALYGSRGLNGAVVITTKSGRTGQGLGIQFTQTLGMDALTSQPRLQNVFGNGTLASYVEYGEKDEVSDNYYVYDNFRQYPVNTAGRFSLLEDEGLSFGPQFDGREVEYYDGTYRPYDPVKNNFKDAYSTGFNSNTSITINGGNEKTTFYTSLSYKYASGILPNNEFQRLSFLGKASHKITDKVKLDVSMAFANSLPKNPLRNIGENFVSGTWGRSYDSSYSKNKYRGAMGLASSNYSDQYAKMPGSSIWWSLYENRYEQKETSVRPVIKLEVDLLDWLKFNTEGSYNYYYTRYEGKEPNTDINQPGGLYEMKLNASEQTNLNVNLIVNKAFEDWTVNGFLRGEYYENFMQSQKMNTRGGLVVPNQFFIGNSKETPEASALISETKKMLSVAFQAGISWRDQLFMDVTGRNDWSSSLVYTDGHGTYSYFYPSVNGSWLITQSLRDELPSWVSFAKVRGSWAQVGNDTSPYTINSAYSLKTQSSGSPYYGLFIPTIMNAADLRPERKNAWEVGLDWRFVNNRIGVDFTYYKENTRDQIMQISIPYQSGRTQQLINAGNIQNKGIEVAANFIPVQTKDWEWGVGLTYTKNENKIISLHENVADYIPLNGDVTYGNYRIGSVAKVGAAYGTLLTDSEKKIDETSGLPLLEWTDSRRYAHYFRNETEIKEIGSMVPDFLGSVSTDLKYKNWTLQVGLDMRFGGYVASYNSRYGTAYGFTERSLTGAPGYGGLTWTSKFDGIEYHDGIIPEGIIPEGARITQADGSTIYTVGKGGVSEIGESYRELFDKGVIEPTHSSIWTYRNNAWTMAGRTYGIISEDWVTKLNYIALRNVALSYRVPANFCRKMNVNNMNLILTGYNLGYLLNSMPNGENPESVSGTAAAEFRVRSFQGITSSFTFTVNIGF